MIRSFRFRLALIAGLMSGLVLVAFGAVAWWSLSQSWLEMLDGELRRAGVPAEKVAGYDVIAPGHLAAAWAVRRGDADACVAPRVAASVFGLDFTPLLARRRASRLVQPSLAVAMMALRQ